MKEVTYKPNLELGTSLLSSERAISCHLVINNEFSLRIQWLGFVVLGEGFIILLLALNNFFGLHQINAKATYKPTLCSILTLPTREGSLKYVKTENTQKYLAMNTQRSDSAIGQVCLGF
jgi:hypothetical protein